MQIEFWNIVLWTSFVALCLKRNILIVDVELTLRKKVKLGGMLFVSLVVICIKVRI